MLGRGWCVSQIGIEISQSLEEGGSPFSETVEDGKHTAGDKGSLGKCLFFSKIEIPNMMIFGDGAFGRQFDSECGALIVSFVLL